MSIYAVDIINYNIIYSAYITLRIWSIMIILCVLMPIIHELKINLSRLKYFIETVMYDIVEGRRNKKSPINA